VGILAKLGMKAAITVAEKEKLRDAIKAGIQAAGMDIKSATPKFYVIDTIANLGTDVGIYYLSASLQVGPIWQGD
jgi:hypothetical protein